ncbi:MAG TPA: hypothetical protein VGG03_27140 [Thermoanaerobaculia bacterium]|jgi:membrane-associated phospholipid phosphatase
MHVVARWVSIIGHPFAMALVMVLGTALHLGSNAQEALRAVLMVAAVALLPIALLMARKVRMGAWENVDASNRRERPVLFMVSVVALAVLAGLSWLSKPDSFPTRVSFGVLAMLALCAVATRWIKLSLHMAFGALAATTLLLLHSPLGWVPLVLLPLLAWSRLALKRHTASEVLTGLCVGVAFGLAIISV